MTLFFFKQKTAYELRISDWSSDVCTSDLQRAIVWLIDAQLRLDSFRRQTDLPADQPTALIDPVTDIRRLDLIRVANCVLRRAEQIADRLTRRQAGACAAKSASCLRNRCPTNAFVKHLRMPASRSRSRADARS